MHVVVVVLWRRSPWSHKKCWSPTKIRTTRKKSKIRLLPNTRDEESAHELKTNVQTELTFLSHPIHYLRTSSSLLPTRDSDPGSHSRLFSLLPATVRAFIFIVGMLALGMQIIAWSVDLCVSLHHSRLLAGTYFFWLAIELCSGLDTM